MCATLLQHRLHCSTFLTLLRRRPSTAAALFRFLAPLLTSAAAHHHFSVAAELPLYLSAAIDSPSASYQTLKQLHHSNYNNSRSFPFLFNTLISGYARSRNPRHAFAVYKYMFVDGFSPDKYTFSVLLKSCKEFSGLEEARQIHSAAVKLGFEYHLHLQNALVHLYGMCCSSGDAWKMLEEMSERDVVSWTGLISGFIKAGEFLKAMAAFRSMDVAPNMATLVSLLVACGKLGDVRMGRIVHGLIAKCRTERELLVGNALIDMYVKCERLDEAKKVFDELLEKDVVSWTSLISGLVQCKRPMDAMEFFHEMQATTGLEPDKMVLSTVLSACASLGALDSGRWVHEYIERKGIEWDVHIGTSMVDMYAKCGCLEMARHTFNKMVHKNVSSWNALLGGLALHGFGEEALLCFDEMITSGFIPNEVTFVAILSACSHAGLVEEGRSVFKSMQCYKLMPWIEHYGCMIDLLCRAGLLIEAHQLIKDMPMKADVRIWGAMLSACKPNVNLERSEEILDHLLELESSDCGVYVLLSNIFATMKRWTDVANLRRIMRKKNIKKEPGSSVIEVDGKAHEFVVGECNHPEKEDIWLISYILARQVHVDWG